MEIPYRKQGVKCPLSSALTSIATARVAPHVLDATTTRSEPSCTERIKSARDHYALLVGAQDGNGRIQVHTADGEQSHFRVAGHLSD